MNKNPFQNIDVVSAQKLITERKVRVIDVRMPYEFVGGHIENAILVPIQGLYEFSLGFQQQNISRDQPLLFVCEMGQRSAAASEVAAIMGYDTVYNLVGGMNRWRLEGLPYQN